MNLLFVNYGDFTTNSINHIAGFTRALQSLGHSCVVAITGDKKTLSAVVDPQFTAATFEELLENPACFPDGRPADILHAWTPRETVRRFVLAYKRLAPSRLVVHLEDNEEHLVASYMGAPISTLRETREADFPRPLESALPHPTRYRNLLRLADGVTVIIDTLRVFVPAGVPVLTLPPGVDFEFYRPQPPDPALRESLGLQPDERVIVFTGSNTFANEAEIRDLYQAVRLLNQGGQPTRLIRTGFSRPEFPSTLPEDWRTWTLELGFIEKTRLPALLALADVLVQPGHPGPFNDYRLPSKLPEFLASGRPVVTAASNLGLKLTSGVDALIVPNGTPEALARACRQLFADPSAAQAMGERGAAFAHREFDLSVNTARLVDFYHALTLRPSSSTWNGYTDAADVTLLARQLALQLHELPALATPAWREIRTLAGDLATQCRDLEIFTEQADAILLAVRAELERDRDEWKNGWRLTDQHARNLQSTLTATQVHVSNVERVLAALKKDHEQALSQEKIFATQIRGLRQQNTAFEDALTQHEAAAVEQQRARQLLQDNIDRLDQQFAQARGQLAALSSELATERQNAIRAAEQARRTLAENDQRRQALSSDLAKAQYQLVQTRARALSLGASSKQEIERLRELMRELVRQRDDALTQRDERARKVAAMQRTFSWQVTSPLRFLRRHLIDPFAKKALPSPPASPVYDYSAIPENTLAFSPSDFVPGITVFRYSIDYPQIWSFNANKVVVRGWCLTTEAVELKKIRARIGDRTHLGVYGLKRMDVLAALRDTPQAEYSGFKIDVDLQESDTEIILEVADSHQVWHTFFRSPLKVGAHHGPAELTSYERWAETYDTLSPDAVAALRHQAGSFSTRPLISVVMPVYHRKPEEKDWLIRAIESVRAQAYPHWELCLADDASPAPHVRPLLEQYARDDARIKPVFREKNGHISAASNSAIAIATGEFIALMDHDDELAPHALFEVVSALNVQPETDYLYSDEDKIDEEGRRHEPYFKPDFLPDLFVGQNYTSHLSVYRRDIVNRIGGFRVGYEGSQDWDLTLRFLEHTSPARIQHIPKVLYHWRAIPGSTALLLSEKNYPVEAARRALSDFFQRRGETIELVPVPGDHWRAKRPRPDPAPRVSLIIPSRNAFKLLSRCVDTLLEKTTYPNYEIVIVDNGSDDPEALAYLQRIASARVKVVRYDAPFNYSAINNYGVKQCSGEIIGLLNNDLEAIHGDWLDEMVSQAVRPEIGCVGAMLYYPNETIQHAGVIVGLGGVAGHAYRDFPRGTEGKCNRARLVQNYSSVTAACLLVRRSVYDQVGGLDETLAVAFNDIDFCLKVRAEGYWNLWTPFAEFYHHESASRGAEDTPEKHERFRREVELMLSRWKDIITHDPAYNPNLSLELTDFSLAAPPRPWTPAVTAAFVEV